MFLIMCVLMLCVATNAEVANPNFFCGVLGKPDLECAKFGLQPVKKDDTNQKTATVSAQVTLVKAGTCYTVFRNACEGAALAAADGKDISHVTYCGAFDCKAPEVAPEVLPVKEEVVLEQKKEEVAVEEQKEETAQQEVKKEEAALEKLVEENKEETKAEEPKVEIKEETKAEEPKVEIKEEAKAEEPKVEIKEEAKAEEPKVEIKVDVPKVVVPDVIATVVEQAPKIVTRKCKYDFDAGIEFPKDVHFPNRFGKCSQAQLPGLALDFKLLAAKVDSVLAKIGGCNDDAFGYLFTTTTAAPTTAEPTTVAVASSEPSSEPAGTTSADASSVEGTTAAVASSEVSSSGSAASSSEFQQAKTEPLVLEWDGLKLDESDSFYINLCRQDPTRKLACSRRERELRIIDVKALHEAKQLGIKVVVPVPPKEAHADYAIDFEAMFKETKSVIVQQLEAGKEELAKKNAGKDLEKKFEEERKALADKKAADEAKAIEDAKKKAEADGLNAEQQAKAVEEAKKKAAEEAEKQRLAMEKAAAEELAKANAPKQLKKQNCKDSKGKDIGPCLVNDKGLCLYKSTVAPKDITICEGDCAPNWNAVTGDWANGAGVSCSIKGAKRADTGVTQVSCNDVFLYTKPDDKANGICLGHLSPFDFTTIPA